MLGAGSALGWTSLATAGFDQTAILWDLSDRDRPRQLGQSLTGHTNAVYGVAFAPDGRTLATVSDDQTATLWDLSQTARLWDLSDRDRPRPLGPPLTGHTRTIRGVAFAPDGHTLATTSTGLNCGSQTSKARGGSRPPWVQIPPLPPSTR